MYKNKCNIMSFNYRFNFLKSGENYKLWGKVC